MEIIVKTFQKIVIRVSNKEVAEKGFETVWDEIREEYPSEDYDLHSIENPKKKFPQHSEFHFFELKPKQKI